MNFFNFNRKTNKIINLTESEVFLTNGGEEITGLCKCTCGLHNDSVQFTSSTADCKQLCQIEQGHKAYSCDAITADEVNMLFPPKPLQPRYI